MNLNCLILIQIMILTTLQKSVGLGWRRTTYFLKNAPLKKFEKHRKKIWQVPRGRTTDENKLFQSQRDSVTKTTVLHHSEIHLTGKCQEWRG